LGDAFHLFREKGGAKKLHTNLLLVGHIEKIWFVGWILLVISYVERRRTLRTAVFLFYLKTDSRGRLSLQALFFTFFLILYSFSFYRLTSIEPRHYGGVFVIQ